MTTELAELRFTADGLEDILTHCGVYQGGSGREAWLNPKVLWTITDDRVSALAATGASFMVYHTFDGDAIVDNVEGESCKAMINVERFLNILDVIDSDNGEVVLKFFGEDGMAEKAEFAGAINARCAIPTSEKDFDAVPSEFAERWSEDDEFLSPSGNPHQAFVTVHVKQIQRIIDAVELQGTEARYPVAIDGSDFAIDIGESDDVESDAVWGHLDGAEVEWTVDSSAFTNEYGLGFVPLFDKTLESRVEMQLSDGATMAVVQSRNGRTYRYAVAPMTQ